VTFENENGTFTYTCIAGHTQNVEPSQPPNCFDDDMCASPAGEEPEETFVEWELTDLNGDDYPDFVFNSAPVEIRRIPTAAPSGTIWWVGETQSIFQLPETNELRAAYNIVGVRFDVDEPSPFALSVPLQAPGSELGVAMWAGDDPDGMVQHQRAGEARVAQALQSQRVATYYRLALPEETERYVLRVMAAKILSDPARYGFEVPTEQP
jgi:hypothetical protein